MKEKEVGMLYILLDKMHAQFIPYVVENVKLRRHLETKLSNEIKRRRDIPQQDMLKQENEDLKEKLMAIFKLNREQLVDFEKTVNGMRKEFSHKAWAK
ncbi:Hypothetical protein CINCED_3A007254 [Cinara cedri]|uniref:Uncharacterized protein n=1 Tax=Cinara cedri TaxID=506608 RepID=A0A5E4NI41_9HEMI|nr:Hypothetical protein CINCED_3A007254 [Cinara cedri]